ncbi:MAG: hypothetical protein U0470_10355 [Anaerolineae bacterium]
MADTRLRRNVPRQPRRRAGRRAYPDGLFVGVATAADARALGAGHGVVRASADGAAAARRRRRGPAPPRRTPRTPCDGPRAFWECLRIALPAWPATVALGWTVALAFATARAGAWSAATVAAPLATLAGAALLAGSVVALKWALLGQVRPGQHAFWSCWCRTLGLPLHGVGHLGARRYGPGGTLLLNAVLRAFEMRIRPPGRARARLHAGRRSRRHAPLRG